MNNSAPSSQYDVVIPDTCNVGIVGRVVLLVNLVFLLGLLALGNHLYDGFKRFIDLAVFIEGVCLMSLILLCGLRKLVIKQGAVLWMQRLVCGAIPGILSFAAISVARYFEIHYGNGSEIQFGYSVFVSFALGIAIQHYLEMRAKAYSPAIGEAKLQALQARIRPHFLFNSLNAVLSLIRTEPKRAETAIEDLADLFRDLMKDTRNMSTIRQEINLCNQYLGIEKIRLGDRLHVQWRIPEQEKASIGNIAIPSLLLQPLIENAVHYGVEPFSTPQTIHISLKLQLEKVLISVSNTRDKSKNTPSGNQMALENIKQRLRLIYDIEAHIKLEEDEHRFEVQIMLPK